MTFAKLLAYFGKVSLLYSPYCWISAVLWQWDLEERKQVNKSERDQRVTWERRTRFQERLKSKVAFMITLRWVLRRRCTSKLTSLSAHAHTIIRSTHRHSDWCLHVRVRHSLASEDTYIYIQKHTHTNRRVRTEKPKAMCVGKALERWRADLCSLPFLTSHPNTLQTTTTTTTVSSSSCIYTITHTPCSPFREKHLLLLQCAEITVIKKEKGGRTRDREKKHIWGSLPVAALLPQSLQSPGVSLMHSRTQRDTRTYTQMAHQRLHDGLIFEINGSRTGLRFVSHMIVWRRRTQAKRIWVGVVGEMSGDTALDTVTMWTEPEDT